MLRCKLASITTNRSAWRPLLIGVVVVAPVLVLVGYAIQDVRRQASDTQCRGNAFSLGYSLQVFGEHFGCFPPPSISDPFGKPLYSWRVLMLASWSLSDVYDAFDFTKPWDDPGNMHLCAGKYDWGLKNLYCCPSATHARSNEADYFYALNDQDRWPRDFFYDPGAPPFLLLVEWRERPVYWSEPVDMVYHKQGLDALLSKLRESTPVHRKGFSCFTSEGLYPAIPPDGKLDSDMRILRATARIPRTADGDCKEETERLVARLIKIAVKDAWLHNRHRALLLLGEIGPQARSAIPAIRQVMGEGNARLECVAAFALAKIDSPPRAAPRP
jgi:hypothetical protein